MYSGPPTMHSGMRRGIGSGMLYSNSKPNGDWPGLEKQEQEIKSQNKMREEQIKARQLLSTLSSEVNGLNKDRELLKRSTANADRALKKTIDYLSPVREGREGVKITTEGRRQAEPPEEVFLKILSPLKQPEGEEEDEDLSRMKTPIRRIDYNLQYNNIKDTERILEMSPPLIRYNPSVIQHTFEMNLDGITLEQLEIMKRQNEDRIRQIEQRFLETNQFLENDVNIMCEFTKDDQYIIKVNGMDVQIPINSLGELNADMLFDTNESEPDEQVHKYPRRLMYELRFEKYLKKKIKDEILRKEKFQEEKYIDPEIRLNMEKKAKIEEMVKLRLNGKMLTPDEEEKLRIYNQAKIDADDEHLILIKQVFNDLLQDTENAHPNQSDEDSYEAKLPQSVDKDEFIQKVLSSSKIHPFLHAIAREPSGVSSIPKETFEQVFKRLQKNYMKRYISWDKVLPYFTRKGTPISDYDIRKLDSSGVTDEVDENEIAAKNKAINNEVKSRMAALPMFPRKDGKGRYKITIPNAPQFEKRGKNKGTSIRERKLQEMVKYNDLEDEYELSKKFKAKPVPKSTLEPRFQNIMEANEKRRQEVKQRSIAMTKQNEKPFSFYERDIRKTNQPPVYDPEFDVMNYEPFKANPVPGHAKVCIYEYMSKKKDKERELRIKRNAELALAQSSLPPRMAMYERMKETNDIQKRSKSLENPEFTFKPKKMKPVPDFMRIQLEFQKGLESKRNSKSLTKMEPFNFCEIKPNKALCEYMDAANRPEEKLATFKMRRMQAEIDALKPPNKCAQSTLKFDAQIAMRRRELEQKLLQEHLNAREELERQYKQTRMKERVHKSPAIVDNTQALKDMRERAKRQAEDLTTLRERQYERKKAEIEINVANRPLLVEMANKNFYKEYLRMKEVENYATLLREANMNVEDHLTDEQKQLLERAEAFEQLNAEHAYFPTVDQDILQQPLQQQMEAEGEEYEYEGDEEEMSEGYVEPVNEVPEMEEMDGHTDNMHYEEEYEQEPPHPVPQMA
jgi:hypothetical protein